jgi:hypothetical protein
MNPIIVICPHCYDSIEIIALNCRVFRHGVMKSDFSQINPHLNKIECDLLKQNNLIFGCGCSFYVNEKNEAVVCDYI